MLRCCVFVARNGLVGRSRAVPASVARMRLRSTARQPARRAAVGEQATESMLLVEPPKSAPEKLLLLGPKRRNASKASVAATAAAEMRRALHRQRTITAKLALEHHIGPRMLSCIETMLDNVLLEPEGVLRYFPDDRQAAEEMLDAVLRASAEDERMVVHACMPLVLRVSQSPEAAVWRAMDLYFASRHYRAAMLANGATASRLAEQAMWDDAQTPAGLRTASAADGPSLTERLERALQEGADAVAEVLDPVFLHYVQQRLGGRVGGLAQEPHEMLPSEVFATALRTFRKSVEARDLALAHHVDAAAFKQVASHMAHTACTLNKPAQLFNGDLAPWDDMLARLRDAMRDGQSVVPVLFPVFLQVAQKRVPDSIAQQQSVSMSVDMRLPHEFYPEARQLRRRIIYHAGPTNSGKTYHALEALKRCERGVFCGPLRLLALEVFDKLNAAAVPCSLLTGQEAKLVANARVTACTVEMASLVDGYDVAVIDEIQMIAADDRGWAWTRALTGLRATEIHVCGDASAVPLLHRLAAQMGDELEVRQYNRLVPLDVAPPLAKLSEVQPGDCLVGFSRKRLFELKQDIESATKLKCCLVYGALPPATRSMQAKAFNDKNSPYKVLVATDAVGMGLNLAIRRVIFDSMVKFDGTRMAPLADWQVKQIAGRAGRAGEGYDAGFVTTLQRRDHSSMVEKLYSPLVDAQAARIQPTVEQLELFAANLPPLPFRELLNTFFDRAMLDQDYMLCGRRDMMEIAALLHKVNLDLRDMYTFCTAPVRLQNELCAKLVQTYARAFASGGPVLLNLFPPKHSDMLRCEAEHAVVDMYVWLAGKYPDRFVEIERAEELRMQLGHTMARLLQHKMARRR